MVIKEPTIGFVKQQSFVFVVKEEGCMDDSERRYLCMDDSERRYLERNAFCHAQ